MSRKLAVFRADAAPEVGLGHVMRCSALAELIYECGWDCAFALSADGAASAAALSPRWMVQILPKTDAPGEAIALSRHWREGCDLLIVDHYGRDALFESGCRDWARRILVIDDLVDRPHDCDVLLDPSPDPREDAYADLISPRCRVLAGLSHALLRPQFAVLRPAALARRGEAREPRRMLVSMGGMDAANLTTRVLNAIAIAAPNLDIDVVLGAGAPPLDAIRACAAANDRISLHVGVEDMASLMAASDLAVGAGGTSSWERCCLGLPSLVLVAADNQRPGAQFLASRGAALVIDDDMAPAPSHIAAQLQRLLGDAPLRRTLAENAAALCDGSGGWRTLLGLLAPAHAKDGGEVSLRLAAPADAMMMYELQTAPETRRYSRNTVPPTLAEHLAWFEKALVDGSRLMTVICHRGVPAGVLRFDRCAEPTEFEISIAVAPGRHGMGLGAAALGLAQCLMPGARLLAEVDPANLASRRLFRGAGFRQIDARHYAWAAAQPHSAAMAESIAS